MGNRRPTNHKEYCAFKNMRARVLQKSARDQKIWKGTIYEGLELQEQWKTVQGFNDFLSHVGPAPDPSSYLDRENNTRGYVYGNVRWVTPKVSANNRRNKPKKTYTINGETKPISEWATQAGVSYTTLDRRVSSGKYTPEEAVSTGKYELYIKN